MEITFLGMNCVRLNGKNISLLFDPYKGSTEVTNNQVTLLTVPGDDVKTEGMVIDSPGEYEIGGTLIQGVAADLFAKDDQTKGAVYLAEIDGIRVAHIGNIAPKLSNEQIEALGQVDVLTIPVGGNELTLDPQAAASLTSQLEAKYVIPTFFDDGKTKFDKAPGKIDGYLKEVGSNPEPVSKLKITPKDLPLETTVVVLSRS